MEGETPMKLLTVKETADVLKVKPQRVYRMMSNDGLPCIRLGRQIRVDEDSLKQWLAAHRRVN
jgi:excisionase family DNA binding protein